MELEHMEGFKCANCGSYLLNEAFQLVCGDRVCGGCVKSLKYKASISGCTMKNCPFCGEEITLDRLYRDIAVERELKTATIKCTNQHCLWKGLGQCYKEHMESCKFTKIPCPNKCFGCIRQLLKSQLSRHLSHECQFSKVECQQCSKKVYKKDLQVHVKRECGNVVVPCPKNCGEKNVAKEYNQLTSGATQDLEPSTRKNSKAKDQQVVLLQNEEK